MTLERLRVKHNNTKMETSTSEVLLPCMCQHSWASTKPTPPQALLAPQLPCTYQHPDLCAATCAHQALPALEPALPGHQGHMLGHQYQPCFSSHGLHRPGLWSRKYKFLSHTYAQAVSPNLECSLSLNYAGSWPPGLPPLASLPPWCPLPTQAEPQS